MKKQIQFVLVAATALLSAGLASAASITMIGPGSITDLSADGSVAVGNTNNDFETFRWTSATGVVPLGRATVPVIHVGGGTPDVSWDGTRVSATILDDTSTIATSGVWTLGSGWEQIPSVPPGGGVVDSANASQWAMSGDGKTMTGFFWRPSAPVHGYKWDNGGVIDLGSDGNQSSGRGVNYDGSVIAGWDEDPANGQRRSTVWVNGVKTVLEPHPLATCEVGAINAAGDVVAGSHYNEVTNLSDAVVWRFSGGSWVMQDVGALPGTIPFSGSASIADLSADGTIGVGINRFSIMPFTDVTGIIWTASGGLMSATDYLASLGLSIPGGFQILQFTSISPDGNTIAGIAFDPSVGNTSFIINVPEPTGVCLLGLIAWPALARRRGRR